MARRPAAMTSGRTRTQRAAEQRADYHAVCLIGFAEALIPRFVGDNMGAVPVRIACVKKERLAAQKYDLGQPVHHVLVLESVNVKTEVHGKRLKAALDAILIGESASQDNGDLRHQWCDVRGCFDDEFTRQIWWGIVLDQAMDVVRLGATSFQTFDGQERERRIKQGARR